MWLAARQLSCLLARLTLVRASEVNRRIERLGGQFLRQRGSHRRFSASANGMTCFTTVPQHRGDIPTGTLAAIERDLEPVFGKGWLK